MIACRFGLCNKIKPSRCGSSEVPNAESQCARNSAAPIQLRKSVTLGQALDRDLPCSDRLVAKGLILAKKLIVGPQIRLKCSLAPISAKCRSCERSANDHPCPKSPRLASSSSMCFIRLRAYWEITSACRAANIGLKNGMQIIWSIPRTGVHEFPAHCTVSTHKVRAVSLAVRCRFNEQPEFLKMSIGVVIVNPAPISASAARVRHRVRVKGDLR